VPIVTTKGLRARQAQATRELLVQTARAVFTDHGYAATSMDEIVQRAGVAKGSLYHHFDSKEAIFRAVYDAVQVEVIEGVLGAAMTAGEPWAAVRAGLAAFLDACLEPSFRRIVVLDSVSVFQHEAIEGGAEPGELPILRTVITPLVGAEFLPGVATEPLAHVALGGLYGAALYIARAPDPGLARVEVNAVLDSIVDGLRKVSANGVGIHLTGRQP
jgi:AcrR family transcriptional regulator